MTLNDLISLWESAGQGNSVTPEWQADRRSLLRHAVAVAGDEEIATLGPALIWRIQARIRDLGLAPRTGNLCTHGALAALLRDGQMMGVVPAEVRHRVYDGVRKLVEPATDGDESYTAEERDQIIEAFAYRGQVEQAMVAMLMYTGCRPNEILGLRQRRIAWNARKARLIEGRRRKRRKTDVKSARSRRWIIIPEPAFRLLLPLRDLDDPEGFIFKGPRGGPLGWDNWRRRWWYRTLDMIGMRHLPPYNCRHTAATIAAEAGVAAGVISKQIGSRITTVEERYLKVRELEAWDAALSAPRRRRHSAKVVSIGGGAIDAGDDDA